MRYLLLIVGLFFIGCNSMSGEDMRKAINECEDNNLSYKTFTHELAKKGSITDIFCVPKKQLEK